MDRREDILRHFPALLARWAGGDAQMRELTVSHPTLRLHVSRNGAPRHLQVACLGPRSIKGPTQWSDCSLQLDLGDPDGFLVTDDSCGLEIKAESVEVEEFTDKKRQARSMGEQRKALGCVIYDMLMVALAIRQMQRTPARLQNLRFGDDQLGFEASMIKCRALLDFLCLPPKPKKHDIIITDLGAPTLTLTSAERSFRTSVNQWCAHLDWQRVQRRPARSDRPTPTQVITDGKSILARCKVLVEGRLASGFRLTTYGGRYWAAFKDVYEQIT